MAAIKPTALNPNGRPQVLFAAGTYTGTGAAVVTWFEIPAWAMYAKIRLVQTSASAGTLLPAFVTADAITATDTVTQVIGGLALTGGLTGAGSVTIDIGPGVTGIANATAAISGTGNSFVFLKCVLPRYLGLSLNGTSTDLYVIAASIELSGRVR